ncbi:MAG: hypothetical protein H5T80_07875, partial [Dietzia sp.]|nr:hypothetical protein [Dietzia sp.]
MRPFYAAAGAAVALAVLASGCAMPSAGGAGGPGSATGGGGLATGAGDRVVLADSAPLGEFNPVSGYGSTGV